MTCDTYVKCSSGSAQKKHVKFSPVLLKHLDAGINKIKSKLLERREDIDVIMLMNILTVLQTRIKIYCNKRKSVIVEFPRKNRWTILKGKKIITNRDILTTKLFQILVQDLIGKEKGYYPFWNKQIEELSKKLWFPTEIDCPDSPSDCSKTSLKCGMSNSWFQTQQLIQKKKNSQVTSCPSYTSLVAEKWEKENIEKRKNDIVRTISIRLFPNADQKKILKKWINTSRYVSNQTINDIETNKSKVNFRALRNKLVTKKNNPKVQDWETETPKEIRANAVKQIVTNYKSAFSNLKKKNIKKFKMKFISKKKQITHSMILSKSCIGKEHFKIHDNGKIKYPTIQIASKKMRALDKNININIRIRKDKAFKQYNLFQQDGIQITSYKFRNWFIRIPITKKVKKIEKQDKITFCGIDPGTRTFMTTYSENSVQEIGKNMMHSKLLDYLKKINHYKSIRDKSKKRKRYYNRYIWSLWIKVKFLIQELHNKTINFLIKNYNLITIGKLDIKQITERPTLNSLTKQVIEQLSHGKFIEKLKYKSACYENRTISEINESYTSKTCTRCGNIKNNLGANKHYNCKKCLLKIDRDVNGARNILLKFFSYYL